MVSNAEFDTSAALPDELLNVSSVHTFDVFRSEQMTVQQLTEIA